MQSSSLFAQVIQDHLELKERNAGLEAERPLDHYKTEDPFENHPLFKTEEQARLEDTMDGKESPVAAEAPHEGVRWPGEEQPEEESLWSRSRDFDWGD